MSSRVALVTGGGRGIGQAISLALAAQGHAVAVNWARDEASARQTVAQILDAGGEAIAVQAAVQDGDQTAAMVAAVEDALGPIGIVVSNGGIASRGQSVVDTSPEELAKVMAVHALGPHRLCGQVLPGMRALERGDIVVISSVAAHTMPAGGAPYSMAKSALEALAYTLAAEERAHGIRVNIVAPGLVASEMGDRLAKAMTGGSASAASDLDASSPFGHVCRPHEVADVVAFLTSDAAGYLTGQRIVIDGGASFHRH